MYVKYRWCFLCGRGRVMLEDTSPRLAISSRTPESSPQTFGETSCAFGRLEGVRKRIYEVYLEAIVSSNKRNPRALVFKYPSPDLVVSSSGQEIGNNFDEGHTGCGGLGLVGGDEWVVTELRRVGENIRPFQVACRVREAERETEREEFKGVRTFL